MADIAQLEAALIKADAAGNAEDARALANEIRRVRGISSAQPSTPAPAQSFKPTLPNFLSAPDYLAHLGSSMVAKPVSEVAGLAALAKNAVTGGDGDPQGFKNYVQNALTYEPRSQEAHDATTSVWNPLNLMGKAVGAVSEGAGNLVGGNAAGDTLRGAAGNLVREGIPQVLGFVGMGRAAPIANTVSGTSPLLGKVWDTVSGRYGQVNAGKIFREAAGGDRAAIRAVMDVAGNDMTAAQAAAGVNNSIWSALGEFAARNSKDSYYTRLATALRERQLGDVADLSGGANMSEARGARAASKDALNRVTTPMREDVLGQANLAGNLLAPLEQRAAMFGEGATNAVQNVRDLSRAAQIGENYAQTGSMTLAPNIHEGMPRISGRYAYGHELANRAEGLATQAASDSLILGEAGRFAQRQADSLAAHGFTPINGQRLVSTLENRIADPAIGTNLQTQRALSAVRDQINEWSQRNGGVISAEAIDGIRKNLNNTIESLLGTGEPKAIKATAASISAQIRPLLSDAIDTASGTRGYSNYLDTFSRGMQQLNREKMAAQLGKNLQTNPATFESIVRGNEPKAVEKVFGAGNYDFTREMGGQRPNSMVLPLQRIADELRRDRTIGEQALAGSGGLERILNDNYSKFHLPNWINAKVAIINRGLREAEVRLNESTLNHIVEGMRNGQNAARILDTMPTRVSPETKLILRRLIDEPIAVSTPTLADQNRRALVEQLQR